MRGERSRMFGVTASLSGSSPHARGTPADLVDCSLIRRFIPACAGNALCWLPSSRCSAVHPRMRGERRMRLYDKGWERGSSPHARGTCPSASACCLPHRFIPACAGNAMTRVKLLLTVAVHPRMRGERSSSSATRSRAGGSSPHARGTHWNGGKDSAPRRFIPACAGNALALHA